MDKNAYGVDLQELTCDFTRRAYVMPLRRLSMGEWMDASVVNFYTGISPKIIHCIATKLVRRVAGELGIG